MHEKLGTKTGSNDWRISPQTCANPRDHTHRCYGPIDEIKSVLSEDGSLLILEDKLLPVGELPTISGFFLMHMAACSALFRATYEEIVEHAPREDKWKERLVCFEVSYDLLSRVSDSSIKECLLEISQRALTEIEGYRQKALGSEGLRDYQAGHRHALAVMQFANAKLGLQSLGAP